MRLSRIWRILQVEESVIHRGRRPRWITPSEISRILHIPRKPNSIIALLFIQNIFFAQTCKLYSRPFLSLLNNTTFCLGFLGQWFNNLWHQWFNNLQRAALFTSFWRRWINNLQRAALFTSFWRRWINNLQRAALLTSLIQYDRILAQQQLFMVNYACGFNQLETGKYFEWIINLFNKRITYSRHFYYYNNVSISIICHWNSPFPTLRRFWKICPLRSHKTQRRECQISYLAYFMSAKYGIFLFVAKS